MRRFIIEQSDSEHYTSHSGLALVGLCINRHVDLDMRLARHIPLRHGISHGDVARTYLGQLCLGKTDFEAVAGFRNDAYFKQALGIGRVPSCERLRQRFDEKAREYIDVLSEANVDLLRNAKVPVTPLAMGHVALDMDVTPMDNSKTHKDGVSRTYKGFDGYAPMAAYLGREGWCMALELRDGVQHSQSEFLYVLERVLPRARALTHLPLLVRLDSGHDALDNLAWLTEEGADFLIKWNPRQADPRAWLQQAEIQGCWQTPRPGKRVALFSVTEERVHHKKTYTFRRVMRVTERTIDKHGQLLLEPQITLDGWWTSLELDEQTLIDLYADHGTSEQFHAELKSELDVERLPSGKFDTNDLVLTFAVLAYNILRFIGLIGLTGEVSPLRHPAKRRRLKTVMQELMYLAARIVATGRRLRLRFSRHCPGFEAFQLVYQQLAYT